MLKQAAFICTVAALIATTTPVSAQEAASLVTPSDNEIVITDNVTAEADADKVSSLIDTMTNNVRACIKTHQASAQECQCKFPDNLDRIKIAYDQALRLHPEWEEKMVSYKKGTEPTTSISFSGIKTQIETCATVEQTK